MTKLAIIVTIGLVSASAYAQPAVTSPWGSSQFVVAYQPPPEVDHSHRGMTLEVALGGGSTTLEASAGTVTFAIGGWLTHELDLAFRVTQTGSFGFVGGSGQYFATPSLWLGAGVGALSERGMDEFGGTTRSDGAGGFLRAGYNLTGHEHVLYVSGELQAGVVDSQDRAVALVAIGYQLL